MKKIQIALVALTLCVCSSSGNIASNFLTGDTYIVIANNVNVRSKPDIKSEVLMQLNITKIVYVLKRSEIKYESGNIGGKWVYVDTGRPTKEDNNIMIKGWVVDYFLAQGHQFEKVIDFYEFKFYDGYGDYNINYDFKRDGTFIYNVTEYCSEKRGMKITDKIKGVLWRYRNVLIAEAGGMVNYFHIDNGRLCFAESKEICVDMK